MSIHRCLACNLRRSLRKVRSVIISVRAPLVVKVGTVPLWKHEVKPFICLLSARHNGDCKPLSWSTLRCRWALLRKDIAQDAFLQHSITVQKSFVMRSRSTQALQPHQAMTISGSCTSLRCFLPLSPSTWTSNLVRGLVPGMPSGGILGKPSGRLPLNVVREIIWFSRTTQTTALPLLVLGCGVPTWASPLIIPKNPYKTIKNLYFY